MGFYIELNLSKILLENIITVLLNVLLPTWFIFYIHIYYSAAPYPVRPARPRPYLDFSRNVSIGLSQKRGEGKVSIRKKIGAQ